MSKAYKEIITGFTYLIGNLAGNPAAEVVAEKLLSMIKEHWPEFEPVVVELSDGTVEYFYDEKAAVEVLYKYGYVSMGYDDWTHSEDDDVTATLKAIEFEEDK